MNIHATIEGMRAEFDEKLSLIRRDVETLAGGGAVSIREVTPTRSRDLRTIERVNVVERRVLDPDQVLIPKVQFDALVRKVESIGELSEALKTLIPIIDRISKRADKADRLSFQAFISLANVCEQIGLHVRLNASGAMEVTGIADRAPELLALSNEVMRMRKARDSGSASNDSAVARLPEERVDGAGPAGSRRVISARRDGSLELDLRRSRSIQPNARRNLLSLCTYVDLDE